MYLININYILRTSAKMLLIFSITCINSGVTFK